MKYRRFIAYLYGENEENIHRNAGFVRVETRGGRCRLQVLVKDTDGRAGCVSAAIIGLPAAGDERESVLLGQMRLCGGCGERTLMLHTEPPAGEGISLDELAGIIVLPDDGSRRLLAIWRAIEKKKVIEPENEEKQKTVTEQKAAPVQTKKFEQKEETERKEELRQAEGNERIEEPWHEEDLERQEKLERQEMLERQEKPGQEEKCEREAGTTRGCIDTDRFRREEILHAMQVSDDRQLMHDEYTISWRTLSLTYPHILPFGRESDWEVLRICVQDIGRLPRKNWPLGANRFLLQNYEEYGHLVLAKSPHGGVFIGVPGEAPAGESRMAKLFGFHEYKTAGRRGYWLAGIEL